MVLFWIFLCLSLCVYHNRGYKKESVISLIEIRRSSEFTSERLSRVPSNHERSSTQGAAVSMEEGQNTTLSTGLNWREYVASDVGSFGSDNDTYVSPVPLSSTEVPFIKPIPSVSASSSNSSQSLPNLTNPSEGAKDVKQSVPSRIAKTNRSVHNQTSVWEHYIFRYRRSNLTTTPTIFLFVVNFHEPSYSPVQFLSTRYFPLFRERFLFDFDVVFLGPKENKKQRVIGNGLPIYGHYSYFSLSVAYHQLCMVESCHYDSFIFMNDDSYVDPYFLLSYPLDKSLIEPSKKLRKTARWMWNSKKNIKNVVYNVAFEQAVNELSMNPKWKKCNFQDSSNRRRGFADFFAISKADIQDYYEMSSVMLRHYAFLEVAAPTINYCLTHKFIDNCNHGPMKNRRTCVHMHPVKYRMPGSVTLALNRLLRIDLSAAPPRMY